MRACKASKLFLIVVVIHVVATVVVVVTVDVADVVADVVAVVSAVENACCCCCGWQLKMSRMLSQLCQRVKFRQAWAIYGIWWVPPYIYD